MKDITQLRICAFCIINLILLPIYIYETDHMIYLVPVTIFFAFKLFKEKTK